MKTLQIVFVVAMALLAPVLATAAPGDLDVTFGNAGTLLSAVGRSTEETRASAVQADGKLVTVGTTFKSVTDYPAGSSLFTYTEYRIVVTRYATNGALDPSFGNLGRVFFDFGERFASTNAPQQQGCFARAITIQSDGKIVVGGATVGGYSCSSGGCVAVGNGDFALLRLNTNGSLDSGFGTGGKVVTDIGTSADRITALSIQSDGRIIAAGTRYTPPTYYASGHHDIVLVRYTDDGVVDGSYGIGGRRIINVFTRTSSPYTYPSDDLATCMVLQNDGKVLLGGNATTYPMVIRCTTNGALDSTFGGDGIQFVSSTSTTNNSWPLEIRGINLQSDGKILLAGRYNDTNFCVARLHPAGNLDGSFNNSGGALLTFSGNDAANAVTPDASGRIVAFGYASNNLAVARLLTNGTFDTSFNSNGRASVFLGNQGVGWTGEILPNGRLVVLGTAVGNFAQARFLDNGALDTSFNSTGWRLEPVADDNVALAVGVFATGEILAAGSRTDPLATFGIARYSASGALSGTVRSPGFFANHVSSAAAAAVQPDGSFFVAGYAYDGATDGFALMRYLNATEMDRSFGSTGRVFTAFASGGARAQAMVVQGDGKVVLGGYAWNGKDYDFAMTRYLTNGALDTSFHGDGRVLFDFSFEQDAIYGLTLQSDGKIIAVGDTWNGSNTDWAVARFNSNGTVDTTFGTSGKITNSFGSSHDTAHAVLVQPDGSIVVAGGYKSTASTTHSSVVARYTSTGAPDTTFDGDGRALISFTGNDVANAITRYPNGKLAIAGPANGSFYVAVLNLDGSPDNTFGTSGKVTTAIGSGNASAAAILLQTDGKIVVAGKAATTNGNSDFALARYVGAANPIVSISNAAVSVSESGSVTLNVQLSTPSAQSASVICSTVAGGTATSGSDFTGTSATLIFKTGETNKTFMLPILTDTTDENDETIFVRLSSPINLTLGGNSNAIVTILDNDNAPTVQFDTSTASVDEGAGSVSVGVNLSAASGKTVTVPITTINQTAVAGSDYTATTATVTFNSGDVSETISVPINNDVSGEPSETFRLFMLNPTNATLGSVSVAAVTILDDEPTVQFDSSAYTISEGIGPATVTVNLSAPAPSTMQISFNTSNGTATAGSDYTATNGVLTFTAGQSSKTFQVPVLNDALAENNETVRLFLMSSSNVVVAAISNATLNIIDTSALPAVQFGVSNVLRSDGSVGVTENFGPLRLHISLSKASTQSVTVAFSTVADTAGVNTDFLNGAGTISFAPGVTNLLKDVYVVNNDTPEANETLTVALSAPVNATLGSPSQLPVTIVDDDVTYLSVQSTNVMESVGSASVLVWLYRASDATITVNYRATNGTAIGGQDFTPVTGTLTFTPGQLSNWFTVPIISDALSEAAETISVSIYSPSNSSLLFSSRTLTINDDDPLPTVSLITNITHASEGNDAHLVTVSLNAAAGRTIFVPFTTTNGSAVSSVDYVATNGVLVFEPGEVSSEITLSLVEDELDEDDENFSFLLIGVTNATLGEFTNAVISIDDDDPLPKVRFAKDELSVTEGARFATFQYEMGSLSGRPVSFTFATAAQTATAAEDFVATKGVITLPTGVTNGTLTVSLLNDAIVEPVETFLLTFQNATNAVLERNSVGVLLYDNDPAAISLGTNAISAVESNGIVSVIVTRPPSGMTSSITLSAVALSASEITDFVATNVVVTLLPDETSTTVEFFIVDDALDEPTEQFAIRVTNAIGVSTVAPTNIVITVIDDDPPRVGFISSNYNAYENLGVALVTVGLSSASSEPVYVDYGTIGGTALPGTDYNYTLGTLIFSPGQTNKSFPITLADDSVPETNKTIGLQLSGFVGGTPDVVTNATMLLTDDDYAQLRIELSGSSAALLWPTTAVGFTLQASTNFGITAWSNVSGALTVTNGENQLTVPLGQPALFRLRR